MASNKLTYSKSGVNISKADSFVKFISSLTRKSGKSGHFKNIGGFGAISPIPRKLKEPHIVTSTDGVGTKIEIANDLNKFDTIGIDLVAMCVNDLVVQGAKPYLFLDYISVSKINLNKLKNLVRGIVKGCKLANCKLVGGETAEMPGTYTKGKFDIAGFSVGLVEKKKILNRKIRINDLILAVPSNGLHSNGFSLVRYLIKKKKINFKTSKFLKEELIRPTKIYVKELSYINEKNLINGCANITGGGLADNIQRIIPKNLCADIDLNNIKTLNIFKWLYKMGISEKEMLKTFNCGVGFCIIINPKNFKLMSKYFGKKYKPYIIGKIVKNSKKVRLSGKIFR
ncbi:phosphoribosylformylglycinamidine cyclo-ligase [Pelagibacterales bacterium SAG-MED23]|nr:phosphoribosylformylglycinamidine cyclo-ligase [Pelagibacterales bacterium SAG-MED23]